MHSHFLKIIFEVFHFHLNYPVSVRFTVLKNLGISQASSLNFTIIYVFLKPLTPTFLKSFSGVIMIFSRLSFFSFQFFFTKNITFFHTFALKCSLNMPSYLSCSLYFCDNILFFMSIIRYFIVLLGTSSSNKIETTTQYLPFLEPK